MSGDFGIGRIPKRSIYNFVRDKNADNLNKICLNYYGTALTFAQFFKKIDIAASALEKIGAKQGDIVTICHLNSPEAAILFFALNKIGATANFVCGAIAQADLESQVAKANSRVVFTLDLFQKRFETLADEGKIDAAVVSGLGESFSLANKIGARLSKKSKSSKTTSHKKFVSWKEFLQKSDGKSATADDERAAAAIFYTSGTEGGAKGAVWSNFGHVSAACQIEGQFGGRLSDLKKCLSNLPFYILYGALNQLLFPISCGMEAILRIPNSESLSKTLKKFRPNLVFSTPSQLKKFVGECAKISLPFVKAAFSCGDFLSEREEEEIKRHFAKKGCAGNFFNCYGMTESLVSANYWEFDRAGSVGVPFALTKIAAFDDGGRKLNAGETGEICVSSPSQMTGYYGDEKAMQKVFLHCGGETWFRTGDLGYVDGDGFLFLTGRKRRFFTAEGHAKKIFCADIERVLRECDFVQNVAVVAVSDEGNGKIPAALAILKSDADKALAEKSLREICKKALPFLARPAKLRFANEFPLTKAGKIDYSAIEKLFAEEFCE